MPHAALTSRLSAAPASWRWALAGFVHLTGTIRGRILIAFLCMSVITAVLGAYAAFGITRAGDLVTKTFDNSLMSINYARAASADFAAMQATFARRWVTQDPAVRAKLDQTIQTLERSLAEDLVIATERSQSTRAATAAGKVQKAASEWSKLRRSLEGSPQPELDWKRLDQCVDVVEQELDLLINYTAGDGFEYRQKARAVVASDIQLNMVGTIIGVLLSALVAWLLARRIIGPVAAASAVAERIARGQLDGAIPKGGADELGDLLGSMSAMRDNIKTMMEREVSLRRSAQARLAEALESSSEGVVVVDAQGAVALANAQARAFFGNGPGLTELGSKMAAFMEKVVEPGEDATGTLRPDGIMSRMGEAQLDDGRWLRISRSTTREGGYIGVFSDISLLKDQEAKLKATNLRLDAALDNMSQGLCLYGADNRLKVVNRRFCEIFGLSQSVVHPGIRFQDVVELSVAAGHFGNKCATQVVEESGGERNHSTGTYFEELADGRVVAIVHRPTTDGGWIATYEDVTERRRAENQIAFMARHDALTNLPNRVLFTERIEQAFAQVGRSRGFGVLCLDLDRFKHVNDTLGHPVGDRLLRAVAERLGACVRESDTVARLGGDEFAIVQCDIARPEDAATLARRIVDTLSTPYQIDGHSISIGVSVGISMAPVDGSSGEKLMKNADVALYRAKSEGRGTWRFFEPEMDARLQARRALELDLRDALARDEFELYYQPIYDVVRDRVCGFEALLRWHHPTRNMVAPDEFIPVAEEIGLIVPLGEWVIRRACAEAKHWPADVKVAVNVSPAQFQSPQLVKTVEMALAAARLPAERLEIEITETIFLNNSSGTLAVLHKLRDLGVRIAMDDFGTGYSSLSYLRSFPFDKIKIDQTFIRDLAAQGDSGVIIHAIVALGRSLGMRTTAEGVETLDQLAILRKEGCDEVQGYYFSRPVCANEVPGLIERWSGKSRAVA